MDEVEPGPASMTAPASVGSILLAARNAAGLSLAEVGARTRVPLRHLEAIETGGYADLPSPTYAVGFAKAYARAVGADEVAVAAQVRADVTKLGRRQPEYTPYEIADPARVPSRGVAAVGLGIAVAVLILIGLWYGTNLFRGGSVGSGGGGSAQPATEFTPVAAVSAPAPTPASAPGGGQVTLAANDEVWLRVYDAANKTLFQGTMKPGDHFDVPADAANPMINVGRPDKLTLTLNGSTVPALGSGERAIKDVPIGAAALAARLSGATAPAPAPGAGVSGGASAVPVAQAPIVGTTPAVSPTPTSRPTTSKPRSKPKPKPKSKPETAAKREKTPAKSARPRRRLTEVQRANLQSAAHPPPPAPLITP